MPKLAHYGIIVWALFFAHIFTSNFFILRECLLRPRSCYKDVDTTSLSRVSPPVWPAFSKIFRDAPGVAERMHMPHDHDFRILVLNPGSTSTKVSVYANDQELFTEVAGHSAEELRPFPSILDQRSFRMRVIRNLLAEKNFDLKSLSAIAGRGGLVKPIESGTYAVNQNMLDDLGLEGANRHASSLGAFLAHDLGRELDRPAFIVDPVVVDELDPVARLSGHPDFPRLSVFHALNHKAVARQCARDMGLRYEYARLIVAHLGGGITVGAHRHGRVVDVNNGISSGAFSPERCGDLPSAALIEACFSGRHTREELLSLTNKRGGLVAYLGTNDLRECEKRLAAGDAQAALVVEAMAYQVAKEIGAMASVLEGLVDAVALSGGLAHSVRFVRAVTDRIRYIAPIKVYPGEKEMEALALGVLRVLTGESEAKIYAPG